MLGGNLFCYPLNLILEDLWIKLPERLVRAKTALIMYVCTGFTKSVTQTGVRICGLIYYISVGAREGK